MKADRKVRISQCMIVKNEEKNIKRALSWGRDIMWEQIVVDTGSTDQTVEIAEKLGAQVYHYTWTDDFAAAKNFALEQAQGDWIAFLDADEYMTEADTKHLSDILNRLSGSQYIAVRATCNNLNDNGLSLYCNSMIRFFRNRPDLRYRGRIHENLCLAGRLPGGQEVLDACVELTIFHTGYAPGAADQEQKTERNLSLLQKEIEERPEDIIVMGYLGDTYRAKEDYDRSIAWYERAVRLLPPPPPQGWPREDTRTFRTLVSLLLVLCEQRGGEEERIHAAYEHALTYAPDEPDLDYVMGRWHASRGEYREACVHLEHGMALLERDGNTYFGARLAANLMGTWELLAICYLNQGELGKCAKTCTGVLSAAPFTAGILKVLLAAFCQDAARYEKELTQAAAFVPSQASRPAPAANGKQVLAFLGRIYDFKDLKSRMFVLKIAEEVEYAELVLAMQELFSAEELRFLKNLKVN